MNYDENHRVVGANQGPCHTERIALADGGQLSAENAADLIDAGAEYWMVPPPGAPAHEAYLATGLPLLLQARDCPRCGKRTVFA